MSSKRKTKNKKECVPVGLTVVGRGGEEWKIGECLGSGTCGNVHVLDCVKGKTKTTTMKFAIKLALMPPKETSTGTKRKKKKKKMELSDLIHYERLVYMNQLCKLQGEMIPQLAPNFISTSNILTHEQTNQSWRFIVMQKMSFPIDQALISFWGQQQQSSTSSLAFNHLSIRMLDIVQAIHEANMLVLDIKPDNFMLHSDNQIFMIDFGLCQTYTNFAKKHRPQTTSSNPNIVGTPLYTFLFVHQGHTPSRRDDLQALFFLWIHFMLHCQDFHQPSRNKDPSMLLPWSKGTSDQNIYQLKQQTMEKPFKQILPSTTSPQVLQALTRYWDLVTALDYAEKPDYEALKSCLKNLHWPSVTPTAPSSAVLPSSPRKRSATKTTPEPLEEESPRKRASIPSLVQAQPETPPSSLDRPRRTSSISSTTSTQKKRTARKTTTTTTVTTTTVTTVEELHSDSDAASLDKSRDETFYSCNTETDPMDRETLPTPAATPDQPPKSSRGTKQRARTAAPKPQVASSPSSIVTRRQAQGNKRITRSAAKAAGRDVIDLR